MPRPVSLPTPECSTDIKGQDGTKQLASLQMAFELPEPAISAHDSSQQHTPTEESSHAMSTYLQPSETVKSRRRSSTAQLPKPKDQFALPPAPTRSCKIIQMKPRPQADIATTGTKNASAPKATTGAGTAATAGNKKKQPTTSSAAGRKIARKTAHSLIERRRRSKMNEEFALLKSMIPACSGEMHKLAILQASIEYVRYLEDCVSKLKEQRNVEAHAGDTTPKYTDEPFHPKHHPEDVEEDASPDVEMSEPETPSPTFTATHSRSQQPSVSPVLLAQGTQMRHDSQSSASSDHYRYGYVVSASTSPAFGPQYHYPHSAHSGSLSALTSPALAPQREEDQEATTALLMLNQSDRRGPGRGMSVRDLLSS